MRQSKKLSKKRTHGIYAVIPRISDFVDLKFVTPSYTARFEEIEAFYNGQAFARTLEGDRVLLNESGAIIHVVWHGVAIAAPDGQRGKTART